MVGDIIDISLFFNDYCSIMSFIKKFSIDEHDFISGKPKNLWLGDGSIGNILMMLDFKTRKMTTKKIQKPEGYGNMTREQKIAYKIMLNTIY